MRAIIHRFTAIGVAMISCISTVFAVDLQDHMAIRNECSQRGSQTDMRDCVAEKAANSEKALNTAYQAIQQALQKWDEDMKYVSAAKKEMASSSKQFERFRKNHCDFMRALAGGAAGNTNEIMRLACVTEANLLRASQLNAAAARLPVK